MNKSNFISGNGLRLIDFSDFPQNDNYLQIEGKLFLADNLDEDMSYSQSADLHYHGNDVAIQIKMTLIFMCVKGQARLKINLQSYTLTPNSVATLPVGSFYALEEITPDFRGMLMAIAPNFMNLGEDIKTHMAIYQSTIDTPIFHLNEEQKNESLMLYRMMKKKLMEPDFKFREQVARAFLDIFKYNGMQSFHEKNLLETMQNTQSRKDEIFTRFIKAVRDHYRNERKVIYYADMLCITPKYLSSVIHESSGKYATEWINDYVIMDAKALLKTSNQSIKEICSILNFPNQSLFSKYFKQQTGLTPKEFRNT